MQKNSNLDRTEHSVLKSSVRLKKHWFYVIVLVFLLLSVYTEVPLFIDQNFYIPSFLTVFSIPMITLITWKRIRKRDIVFIIKTILVLLLTVFFSIGSGFIGNKLIGVLQTTVAIIAGVLLVKIIDYLKHREIEGVFLGVSFLLFVGALLEVTGVIRDLSNSFREMAFGQAGYTIYSNYARDILLAGFERPSFFTAEPSYLAIGFFVFSNAWLVLNPSLKKWLTLIASTSILLYITASFILIISILSSILVMMLLYNRKNHALLRYLRIGLFVIFLIVILALLFALGVFNSIILRFSMSIANVQGYTISSENIRMVFPYLTMIDVLRASPLFGVGISGKDIIGQLSTLPIDPSYAFGNNNFAALFIYMGIMGSILFVAVLYRYLVRLLSGTELLLFTLFVIGLSQTMGGFESLKFWGYIFIFIGVLKNSNLPLKRYKHEKSASRLSE